MKPFLQRYYDRVSRELGDPHASARYPEADRYDDLIDIEEALFNQLLKMAGQESMLGYAEATITLTLDTTRYLFPEGFRQFIALEQRDTDGRLLNKLMSKPTYDTEYGVEILTATKGFRLHPALVLEGSQDWTLRYLRSPGELHYAYVGDDSVTSLAVRSKTPPANGGNTYFDVDDYYAGTELRIFQADTGQGQIREVKDFKNGTFVLRHAFDPLPQGNVGYEIVPSVPKRYDSIYALDAAIHQLIRRKEFEKAGALKVQRAGQWDSLRSLVISNTMDRAPARLKPLREEDFVPSGDSHMY